MVKALIASGITDGQKKQYLRLVEDIAKQAVNIAIGKVDADQEGWQRVLENGDRMKKAIIDAVVSKTRELSFACGNQIAGWNSLYRSHFNLTLNLSGVQIPDQQEGFDRLLVVAKGMTCNKVYDVLAKQFPCWRYSNDLDKDVPINDRDPKNGSYAVWVRDRQEADEENKNQSANQRREQGHTDETLLERMLHELKFFDETGKHLDLKNWTLCAGSRRTDGGVPFASWHCDEFFVAWFHPDDRYDVLRARSVVSCQPKPERA